MEVIRREIRFKLIYLLNPVGRREEGEGGRETSKGFFIPLLGGVSEGRGMGE